ncbi:MAG: CGP-CTERM sorting domain-containing protein [Thermococci archaeon]|nr:CGP-CTERM sorting domain-containing protein [Thermococci archaeon]
MRTYGGAGYDRANAVALTPEGDVIVAGVTTSSGNGDKDAVVMKLAPNGSVIWAKTYGGPKNDTATAVAVAKNGDLIVAGYTDGSPNNGSYYSRAWVLKLSPNGSIIWQKTYGNGNATAVALTPNGDVIVAGFNTGEAIQFDWVLKLSPNGSIIWQRSYLLNNPPTVAVAPNGNVIIAGGGIVMCLNEKGNMIWKGVYKNQFIGTIKAVAVMPNGDIITVGETMECGMMVVGGGPLDLWVLKLSPNGSVIWQNEYRWRHVGKALDVTPAPDGGLIVAGWMLRSGKSRDAWVLKLNSNGSVVWQRSYGGLDRDGATSVAVTQNGSIVIAGYTFSFGEGGGDIWVLKLPPNGSLGVPGSDVTEVKLVPYCRMAHYNVSRMMVENSNASVRNWTVKPDIHPLSSGGRYWVESYDGNYNGTLYDIRPLPNGDMVAVGYVELNGTRKHDALVMKLSPNGSVIWAKTYGGPGDDRGRSVAVEPNGDIVVVGVTKSFGAGDYDFWVLKLSPNGSIIWQKTYGGSTEDIATSVVVTKDGNILVGGYSTSFCIRGCSWILKLSPNGSIIWQRTYKGAELEGVMAMTIAPNGDILATGLALNMQTRDDVFVLRLNENGSVIWQKAYGGNKSDIANGITVSKNGSIVVAGWTGSFGAGDYDFWVLKLSPNGSIIWQKTYGGAKWDLAAGVALTKSGDMVVVGTTYSFGFSGFRAWILKLSPNGSIIWQRAYRLNENPINIANAVAVTSHGAILIAGSSTALDGVKKMWILRLPPNGNVSSLNETNATPANSNCSPVTLENMILVRATNGNVSVHVWKPEVKIQFCTLYGNFPRPYWMKTYGGPGEDVITSVGLLSNGDIVAAGYTDSSGAGSYDVLVMKLAPNGSVIWAKTYGGPGEDVAKSITVMKNGDMIVAGYTDSFGAGRMDAWVLKLSPNGSVIWSKTYGGLLNDRANAVALTDDGNVVVVGTTASFGAGGSDVWVLKLSPNGSIIWSKTYGGGMDDGAKAVAITKNGSMMVAGYTYSSSSKSRDAWVLKLSPNGSIIWQKAYGGLYTDIASGVVTAPNGDVIVAGTTTSFGCLGEDVWVFKLSPNGSVIWSKLYGESNADEANGIVLTPNKELVVAGVTSSLGVGNYDAWMLKLTMNGSIIWQRVYGGKRLDWINSVLVAPNGDIIAGGYTNSFSNGTENSLTNNDAWVLRLPPYGAGWTTNVMPHVSNCSVFNTSIKVAESNVSTGSFKAEVYQFLNSPPETSTTSVTTTSTTTTKTKTTTTTVTTSSTSTTSTSTASTSTSSSVVTSSTHTVTNTTRETSATKTATAGNESATSSTGSAITSTTATTVSSTTATSNVSSTRHVASSSSSSASSSSSGNGEKSICGPAAIVGLSLLTLTLKRKRRP